jgi:hypothetical protein
VLAVLHGELVALVLAPIFVGLATTELDRSGRRIAVPLVRLASHLLPAAARQEHVDEWVDHVLAAGEEGMRPVLAALSIAFWGAPVMGAWLRYAARPQPSQALERRVVGATTRTLTWLEGREFEVRTTLTYDDGTCETVMTRGTLVDDPGETPTGQLGR